MIHPLVAPAMGPSIALPEAGTVLATNHVPPTDLLDRPTGCCPRFHADLWDDQALHFENKRFARATSCSVKHVPQDMAPAYAAAACAIEKAGAWHDNEMLVLNRIVPGGAAEHLFAVRKDVPQLEMVRLDGDYRTRVFEGPYDDAPRWQDQFRRDLARRGLEVARLYLYFTTCPACAEALGANYVVAVARLQG